MTYQDPDPLRDRDIDPRLNPNVPNFGSSSMWGWIAGMAVLVLLLVFLFGSGAQNVQTTDSTLSPAAPTITTPRGTPPPAAPAPAETTGQGSNQQ